MEKIGFGGGCHWCTEGVFQALRGIASVDQGFIQSEAPSDAWAEGVIVTFDPRVIGLAMLAEVHLRTHSANGTYSPGGRYRSAIYILDAAYGPLTWVAILAAIGGFGGTIMMAAALMGLAFLSSGTGHDEDVERFDQ